MFATTVPAVNVELEGRMILFPSSPGVADRLIAYNQGVGEMLQRLSEATKKQRLSQFETASILEMFIAA